jgi:hypothetical protein
MERRKETRLAVELPGSYRTAGGSPHSIFFSQLSSRGCRVTAAELGLSKNDPVKLHLGPIGPITADVRWVGKGAAGVEFREALDAAVVGYFAAFINDVA